MFPSRIKYLYFSQTLRDDILRNRRRKLELDYEEALTLENIIETCRKPRKKYRNSNHFLSTHISYTFPLKTMDREDAIKEALKQSITGREGFFALVSSKDFSVHEALRFYREKDVLENLFNSMKNEIHLRPTRV